MVDFPQRIADCQNRSIGMLKVSTVADDMNRTSAILLLPLEKCADDVNYVRKRLLLRRIIDTQLPDVRRSSA